MGDRTKIENFVQECDVYLNINQGTYDNDVAKIAFVLSFIMAGEAVRGLYIGIILHLYTPSPSPLVLVL